MPALRPTLSLAFFGLLAAARKRSVRSMRDLVAAARTLSEEIAAPADFFSDLQALLDALNAVVFPGA